MRRQLPFQLSADYQSYKASLDARRRRTLEDIERRATRHQPTGIGWFMLAFFLLGFLVLAF